jgi:hypothetical protein
VLERLFFYSWPGLSFEAYDIVAFVGSEEFRVYVYSLRIQLAFVLLLLCEILYRILFLLHNNFRIIFEFAHRIVQGEHEFVRLPADVGYLDDEHILKQLVHLKQHFLQWIGIHECGELLDISFDSSGIKVDALIQQDLAVEKFVHVAMTSHVDG